MIPSRWQWPVAIVAIALPLTLVAVILVINSWSTPDPTTGPESAAATNPGLIAVVPEPTETDTQGQPVPPVDPFMPPPNQSANPSAPNTDAGPGQPSPLTPPTSGSSRPDQAIPSPPPPSPPPSSTQAVPSTEAIACRASLQPGPASNTVRLSVTAGQQESRPLWVRVEGSAGLQDGMIQMSSGISEQVIPGVGLLGTRVFVYTSPAMTAKSLSCTVG